jgi:hypothetical protein
MPSPKSIIQFYLKKKEELKLKAKKLFALLFCAIMVLSLAGCKGNDKLKETDSPTDVTDDGPKKKDTEVEDEADEKNIDEPVVEMKEASLDFEDGLYGFAAVYTAPSNADTSELSIADFNGSKALKVTNVNGKIPYIAIDIASLVGDKIADVRNITMDISTEHPDGNFYATSGKIIAYSGEDRIATEDPWSVYLAKKNPNTAKVILGEGEEFVAGFQNMIILSLQTDNALAEGIPNANIFIDNIRVMDAAGNIIKADSTVAFAEPKGFSDVDKTNLLPVKNEVELWTNDSGIAYAQGTGMNTLVQGGTIDPAIITENTVITIYYESEGDMWLVAQSWEEGAPFSWQRVADLGASIKNPSNTIAQVTYEQMVEYCQTDDFVTYLSQLQCESDMDWSVTSVTIGERSGITSLKNEVEIGAGGSGDVYTQGVDITTLANEGPFDPALIQPGCVINIEYKSEGGMWLVAQSWVDGAPFSWQRVADEGKSLTDGSICQITYDQLVEACGTDDFVTYLSQLQCESDMPWEVYRVSIGYPSGIVSVKNEVEIGALGSGDAYAQGVDITTLANGGSFDPALIQPGCVISIDYESEGMMWLVAQSWVDGAPFSWQRVADQGVAADSGKRAQVTYDQLVDFCGTEDFVTYLSQLQCESDMPWEVNRVTLGYPVN